MRPIGNATLYVKMAPIRPPSCIVPRQRQSDNNRLTQSVVEGTELGFVFFCFFFLCELQSIILFPRCQLQFFSLRTNQEFVESIINTVKTFVHRQLQERKTLFCFLFFLFSCTMPHSSDSQPLCCSSMRDRHSNKILFH